jgi:hypothetical protein
MYSQMGRFGILIKGTKRPKPFGHNSALEPLLFRAARE